MWQQASRDQTRDAQLHVLLATLALARRTDDFMNPAAFIELRVEEDRLAVEVSNQDVLDFAAVNQSQDGYHGLGRREPANVEMYGV